MKKSQNYLSISQPSALKQMLANQMQQVQELKNLLQFKVAFLPGLESLTSVASLMESPGAAIPALTPTDQVSFQALFIIDKKGIIQHVSVYNMALGRNVEEVFRLIDALQHVEQFTMGESLMVKRCVGDESSRIVEPCR